MLDIILIIIVALSIFVGYKKGFVSVTLKLIGFILALILAIIFKNSVADFANRQLGLGNTISTTVEKSLNSYIGAENNIKSEDTSGNKKENFENNNKIFNFITEEVKGATEDQKAEIISKQSDKIALFVLKGLSFITIFIIVRVIVWIVGLILNTVVNLPVLKTFNGFAGAGIQCLIVIFEIFIVLSIISFLSPLETIDGVEKYINNSVLVKWMYNNNILVNVLMNKVLKG